MHHTFAPTQQVTAAEQVTFLADQQVLYVVVWCAIFSTLHLYIAVANYWVLCLCVSLVAIFLTAAVIFILHHSGKEVTQGGRLGSEERSPLLFFEPISFFFLQLNVNTDVRLIQANERLAKHQLLVAVAEWVQNCSGKMQVDFKWLTPSDPLVIE